MTSRGLWADAWARLEGNPWMVLACIVLAIVTVLVVAGPWLSPHASDAVDAAAQAGRAPSLEGQHWFGTDAQGRDLYVRTLEGGRVTLAAGIFATIISIVIGVAWGAVAGYVGGRIDTVMMRSIDVLHALPLLLLVVALMVVLGRNPLLLCVAIGLINWLETARIVRHEVLALKERAFVDAAKLAGLAPAAVVRRHIVPNLMGLVVATATLTVPQVIMAESFVSFLGLGMQEPAASWGTLISTGAAGLTQTPWGLLFPAAFLVTTLFCINYLGDGLRDALELRERLPLLARGRTLLVSSCHTKL